MAGARAGRGTDELRLFIRTLGTLPVDIRKELRPALRKAGQGALIRARINASWSTRIPAAIRLQISLTGRRAAVALVVDQRKAPHGRALENLGNRGFFRHPVFGRDRWVRQAARPYLFSAARAEMERMDNDIAAAVDAAARNHGFREGGT